MLDVCATQTLIRNERSFYFFIFTFRYPGLSRYSSKSDYVSQLRFEMVAPHRHLSLCLPICLHISSEVYVPSDQNTAIFQQVCGFEI